MPARVDRLLKQEAARVFLSLFLVTGLCLAQQRPGHPSQNEIAQQLANPSWLTRAQAVSALQSIPVRKWQPRVISAVISTFGMEQRRLTDRLEGNVPETSYPEIGHEVFAEYYSALAGLVLELNDPRALPLIVNYAASSDPRVTGYIARRGKRALPLVLARLRNLSTSGIQARGYEGPDFLSEQAMLDTLGQIVLLDRAQKLPRPLSTSDLARIRVAVRPLLHAPNPWVATDAARALAISGAVREQDMVRATFARLLEDPDHNRREIALSRMGGIADSHFLPMRTLKRVAQHDSFRLAGPAAGYPAGAHPLRREASQILERVTKAR